MGRGTLGARVGSVAALLGAGWVTGCLVSFDGYYVGRDAADAGPADAGSADADADAAGDAAGDAGLACAAPQCATACTGGAQCVAGECADARLVFVTSSTSTADVGGVAGADARCASSAAAAGLPGQFRAWLSIDLGADPATTFTHPVVPYLLVDGTMVASRWTDLTDGALAHAIDRDECGAPVAPSSVWTGTSPDGSAAAVGCAGFTSGDAGAPSSVAGRTDATGAGWSDAASEACDRADLRLYCFEQ